MDPLERVSGVSRAEAFQIDRVNLYERLGERPFVALVATFYERVYADPDAWFRRIFAGRPREAAVQNLQEWLIQRVGGPKLYTERKGHPGLISRHMQFSVTGAAAERWLAHMEAALLEQQDAFDDRSRQMLSAFFRHTAWFIKKGIESMRDERKLLPQTGPNSRSAAEEEQQEETIRRERIAAAVAAASEKFSPHFIDIAWCELEQREGTGMHHWSVTVVSDAFEGVSLLDRHRAVLQAVSAHLLPGQGAQEDSSMVLVKAKTVRQWAVASSEAVQAT